MTMAEKKNMWRSECPFRVCGAGTHRDPKPSRKKVIGDRKQIHICPLCAARTNQYRSHDQPRKLI